MASRSRSRPPVLVLDRGEVVYECPREEVVPETLARHLSI